MSQIELNGLLWDTENLKDENGNDLYCTFEAANETAKYLGRRLPTKEEFEALVNLPHVWEAGKKGMLFGELFLPARGYRYFNTDAFAYVDTNGCYWSASPNSTGGYYLGFNSYGNVHPANSSYHAYGFTVRCVQDK
ncbi:fibrobacter succinogenes major paralogous domain-containing protein [Bacteroides ihuae]|uniref:DUF1566 domain-containing protein n=1 Tax=Bacteroides ihuae TaxID=1852362 RepID=UPI0008DB3248|nr:DUF1566 domain-containing protein [Bacteroides ihuae]